jgi:hypothetical protein
MNKEKRPTQPCNNCPYRCDAPLQLWHREEFLKLLENDATPIQSPMYSCHKNNGHGCVGWLINQRERRFPSIQLRLKLMEGGEEEIKYLYSLSCDSEMYKSIEEMILTNFPDLKR